MKNIKYFVMDVDGTLTDGKIYMGQDGEAIKAFNIKDGCGIKEILPKLGIMPVVITARISRILENRCNEIGITEVYQGFRHKLGKLEEITNGDLESVVYVGDDIPDLPCMEAIKKAGGIVMCPSDSISEIKSIADYVSNYRGGEGAVRDCINLLASGTNESIEIEKRIETALNHILNGDYVDKPEGVLPDGNRYYIQEYATKTESECVIETHRHHIDIQYIISGKEILNIYEVTGMVSSKEYNQENDFELWKGNRIATRNILVPGSLIVIKNNQFHQGGIKIDFSEIVRKLVCKIDID